MKHAHPLLSKTASAFFVAAISSVTCGAAQPPAGLMVAAIQTDATAAGPWETTAAIGTDAMPHAAWEAVHASQNCYGL